MKTPAQRLDEAQDRYAKELVLRLRKFSIYGLLLLAVVGGFCYDPGITLTVVCIGGALYFFILGTTQK